MARCEQATIPEWQHRDGSNDDGQRGHVRRRRRSTPIFFGDEPVSGTLPDMADELTLQDVVNHMSNGFAQLNGQMDRFEGRMGRLESDMKDVKSRLCGVEEQLQKTNERLTAIEEDLLASMEDIGVIKSQEANHNRRFKRLEVHVGLAA